MREGERAGEYGRLLREVNGGPSRPAAQAACMPEFSDRAGNLWPILPNLARRSGSRQTAATRSARRGVGGGTSRGKGQTPPNRRTTGCRSAHQLFDLRVSTIRAGGCLPPPDKLFKLPTALSASILKQRHGYATSGA